MNPLTKPLILSSVPVLVTLLAAGCNVVESVAPIGEKPAALKPEEIEGEWYHPDGTLTISILDPGNGLVEIGSIKKDAQAAGRLKLETERVLVRSFNDWLFFNIRQKDPERKGAYLWGRVKIEPKRLLVWFPNPKKFADLVRTDKIPGRVDDKGNVILWELEPSHLELIASEPEGPMFIWDSPMVLFRRSDP